MRPTASDEAILDVVRAWVALLAAGRYRSALDFVPAREHWNAALLRTVIESYGSPQPRPGHDHRVSPIATTVGEMPRHAVARFDGPPASVGGERGRCVGEVWFDLPLDGEWSDLTATFELVAIGDGLALSLDEVHVH